MSAKWDFPLSTGQINGAAESGMQTFAGNPLPSLIKEMCQNTLDARAGKEPAKIVFKLHTCPTQQTIPGYETLKNVVRESLEFWRREANETATHVLTRSRSILQSSKCSVLQISDYNTIGLSGPYNQNTTKSGWLAMTLLEGGATKDANANGSFGIGKNAAYINSNMRMVFIRTLNMNNERAVQGLCKLPSFRTERDGQPRWTQGTGYFGEENQRPIQSIAQIDQISKRVSNGTDVFIFGFANPVSGYEADAIDAALENFLIPILNGDLVVEIEDSVLDAQSLPSILQTRKDKLPGVWSYFEVLTSPEHKTVKKQKEDGNLVLKYLVDPQKQLNRKILITRQSGMRLFELKNLPKNITFSGIFSIEGKELNSLFRRFENPQHTDWENKGDPQNRKHINEVKQWIRSIIQEASEAVILDSSEISGLSSNLNSEQNGSLIASLHQNSSESPSRAAPKPKQNTSSKENEKRFEQTLRNVEITPREERTSTTGTLYRSGESGKRKKEKVPGRIDDKGGSSGGIRSTTGVQNRSKKEAHRALPDPTGRDTYLKPAKGGVQEVQPIKTRVIKLSDTCYRVNLTLDENLQKGYIEITTVGEESGNYPLQVLDPKAISGCSLLKLKGSQIHFDYLSGEEKVRFDFYLRHSRHYAMKVNIYESGE